MRIFRFAAVLAAPLLGFGCVSDIPLVGDTLSSLSLTRESDEEAITRVLDDVHRGMETERIYRVLAHVSRTYRDAEGRDYGAMELYLNDLFRRYRDIRIDRGRPRIVVQGDKARVIEAFGGTADPLPGSTDLPLNIQGQVSVYMEKIGGAWQIVEWGNLN